MNRGKVTVWKVVVAYLIVSITWVFVSDFLTFLLTSPPKLALIYSATKGVFFVLVTAGLLYIMMGRTVAKLSEAEQRAQRAYEDLDTALELARTGVWRWNIATQSIEFKGTHAEPKRVIPDDSGFERILGVLYDEERDRMFADIGASVSAGTPLVRVYAYRGPENSRRYLEARADAIRDETGKPIMLVGTTVDCTDRVELQNQLESLTEQLESRVQDRTADLVAANEQLEAFTHSVAHDLRSPLRTIHGFTMAIEQDLGQDIDSVTKENISRIKKAAVKMSDLIDDMLTLSRVTRVPLQFDGVNVSRVCEQILEELTDDDPTRRVDCSVQSGIHINADPRLVEIALQNILGNAWKYTSKIEDPKIEVKAETMPDSVLLWVKDNGIGFEQKFAQSVFEPFNRLVTDNEYPGTGIGLATASRILRRHNGKIWAESEPNQGTTICMEFPVRKW